MAKITLVRSRDRDRIRRVVSSSVDCHSTAMNKADPLAMAHSGDPVVDIK